MTGNRTAELLSCPHCGKVDTLELSTRRELEDCPNFEDCEAETCGRGFCDMYDNWDCVVCSVYKGGCGASGGYDECPAKAIEKWNTRTTEQAIAATLGSKGNRISERLRGVASDMRNIGASSMTPHELFAYWAREVDKAADLAATLGGGKLTADWVRGFLERHSMFDDASWTHGTTELVFDEDELPAMADELNAELGSGTCEIELRESGWGGYTRHCGACGADLDCDTRNRQNFCPNCGKAVKR